MLKDKKAILLDLNNTFMFGGDRFEDNEDYSEYYKSLGGKLPFDFVNELIKKVFDYLECRYPAEVYRHCFPSLRSAIENTSSEELSSSEVDRIIETFSFHEHGEIPEEYVVALKNLHKKCLF